MNPFRAAPRTDASWLFVGPASAFPDIDSAGANLSQSRACNAGFKPGCKVFSTSSNGDGEENGSQNPKGLIEADLDEAPSLDLKSQVLVFRVVFVHGLRGDAFATWTKDSTCWPRDLLPYDAPNARIITVSASSLTPPSFTRLLRNP
ncbi:hypothetical protein VE03_00505 [Pseudogymnoascus sp. 23342-1-I1]|nr:hypothetical protein VE03_00505 [Pseudogymnoascus sp. 23342-1-I1]